MGRVILSIAFTFLVISIVPFIPYSILSAVFGLELSQDVSLARFMASVFITKAGTALAFVLIFYVARHALRGRWALYACLWWMMFVIHEIGQAIGPGYGWMEAVGGIIAESVYCPLSAYLTHRLILGSQDDRLTNPAY